MYTLIIKDKFDAAHYLIDYDGDCANIHGHTWRIEVELIYSEANQNGLCDDFKHLKKVISSILPDHKNLNEIYTFNPTAEHLAKDFYWELAESIPVLSVTVWESESCGAKYYE